MEPAIQDYDFIVTSDSDKYHVWQMLDGERKHLEGPYDRARAERRAKELALAEESDVWLEDLPGAYHLIS
jgi:hypothetical protein